MKGFSDQFLPALIAGLVVLIVGVGIQIYISQKPAISGNLFFNKSEVSFSNIRNIDNEITRRSATIFTISNLDETSLYDFELVFTGIRRNEGEFFDLNIETQDALLKNEVSGASVERNGYLRVQFQRMGENGQATVKFLSDYGQGVSLESATDGLEIKEISRFTTQSRSNEKSVASIVLAFLSAFTALLAALFGSLLDRKKPDA